MGNITADEFIYYLELQLGTPFDDGGSVKRVVIDDLQIVDFCFPFLKSSTLFLSALVAICRERGIQLFILCDKSASKVAELRAVSDNIICTGRNKQGKLQLYIERYIGFTNNEVMYQYNNLLMSAFSSVSFVLVLGKLNSNYLQIPRVFLFIMYAYAIIQAYVPFRECTQKLSEVGSIINGILPFATLIGKVFVMLALCWVADKKRLIFFIIHESVALDETPMLLDELDSDPVEF